MELLAVVWPVDRYKHYLLGKSLTIATDHKALTSASDSNKSNKTYQSRLTRWVDRLLPYQFQIVHIPGRDMGIVDYLSRDPCIEPWRESELDEKFVVATINSLHEAFYCMSSRLEGIGSLDRNENLLEGMYQNSHRLLVAMVVQKRTELDRNERTQFSRLSKQLNNNFQEQQITSSSSQLSKQSFHKTEKKTFHFVNKVQKKQTNSEKEMAKNFNRSYDWWSDTPQEWRNVEREESILDLKWNRSLTKPK